MHVTAAAAAVLHYEIHPLDALRPIDLIVLPEGFHGDIFFIHALFLVEFRVRAAIAMANALVRNPANAPRSRFAAGRFLQYFQADVHGAVAIINRRRPIFRTLRIQLILLHVEMRFARRGVVGVGLGKGEGDIEHDELSSGGRGRNAERDEQSCQQGKRTDFERAQAC